MFFIYFLGWAREKGFVPPKEQIFRLSNNFMFNPGECPKTIEQYNN